MPTQPKEALKMLFRVADRVELVELVGCDCSRLAAQLGPFIASLWDRGYGIIRPVKRRLYRTRRDRHLADLDRCRTEPSDNVWHEPEHGSGDLETRPGSANLGRQP